jgi:hypothetical protein
MKLRILIAGSVLFLASLATAQTAVLPPPNPSGGAALATTMQFIQESLNHNGLVSFYANIENTDTGEQARSFFHNEVTDVVADPGQCQISFHWRRVNGKGEIIMGNASFPLRDAKTIAVRPYEQFLSQELSRTGHPNATVTSTMPPITIVELRRLHSERYFLFTEAAFADRVAQALNRAVELCGGGS